MIIERAAIAGARSCSSGPICCEERKEAYFSGYLTYSARGHPSSARGVPASRIDQALLDQCPIDAIGICARLGSRGVGHRDVS